MLNEKGRTKIPLISPPELVHGLPPGQVLLVERPHSPPAPLELVAELEVVVELEVAAELELVHVQPFSLKIRGSEKKGVPASSLALI